MVKRRPFLVAAIVTMLVRQAYGEPVHLKTPSTVRTDGGSDLRLPPGYFLPEPEWKVLDGEVKRLQEREVRLVAENESLRKSARDVSFGWYALGAAVTAGFVAGWIYAK